MQNPPSPSPATIAVNYLSSAEAVPLIFGFLAAPILLGIIAAQVYPPLPHQPRSTGHVRRSCRPLALLFGDTTVAVVTSNPLQQGSSFHQRGLPEAVDEGY